MNDDESRVFSALQTDFNYENFKNEVQKEATIAINKGLGDICISLPPGFGRSLCYELPAVLQNGKIVIVISPKLCSMKRHVEFLIDKRINAHLLSLNTRLKEQQVIMKDLMSNRLTIKLLYATPEMTMTVYFRNLVHSLNHRKLLLYVVFNEAHCVSEQGHEYIPCYKKITSLNNVYGSVPRVAVTTAVTHEIIEDICQSLTLRSPRMFKVPVQLMNIYHDVWFLDILPNPFDHLKNFIIESLGLSDLSVSEMHNCYAIVYCKEEAAAESLRSRLVGAGIPTLACHHKLNDRSRHKIESQWLSGEASAMVTTYDYEFIHRKLIKCKVYWAVPQNIPKYYRESVQSLTDNRMYCRTYFRSEEQMEVVQYRGGHHAVGLLFLPVDTPRCRHTVISEYFGHVADPCKVNCDVCEDRDTVKARTFKFIAYSESVQQIKYDICDISDDTKEEQSRSVKEKSPERAEKGAKKCSAARGEISIDENNNGAIVQYRDKQTSSSSTEGGYIQPCSSSTVKRAKDNSNATGANELVTAGSLLAKYNLNNELSLEPCGSKNNAANTSIRIDGTQISSGRSNTRTRTVGKEGRVTGNDSYEVIFVGPKKRNKRYANRDTCRAEFSSTRRKIETENEPTAVPRDRSGSRTSDRDERVKDDANEIVSHTESRIKGANSNIKTRTVEEEDRVTGNDSCEVIFVGPKKRNKRYANRDTCPAEFSSTRRKIETENEPTAVPRDRSGSRTSDRDERVKDDANEIVSHTESRIKGANSNIRTRTVEKEDRVTGNDSCEVIFVGPKKRNKRYANRDTCPAEFSSTRRKIETENEPTAVPRDRSGSRTSDRDERVKDDANEIVSHTESRIKGANSNIRTRTVEKEDRVTGNDSCEVIFVGPKKRNKRYANRDTCPAEFSSTRRKIETENEPTAVPRDRSGSRTSDRDERVKDDANETVSRCYATAEYLMNKYKLDKQSITLEPCRK